MPSLKDRLAKIEKHLPNATVVRAVLSAFRRARASGCLVAEDAAIVTAGLNDRTLERQLRELTDDELREGIELLREFRAIAGTALSAESCQ